LKFTIPLLPYASIYYTPVIEVLCCLGFFCCGFDALRQIDFKKIVAYSSVVHMNLVVLAIFTNTLKGLLGAVLMMVAHGLTSAGMFFCLGALYDRFKTRNILYSKGLVHTMPIFCTLMFIFMLTNIGFPGSINFVSEVLCFCGILQYNFSFILIFLFFGLLINTIYNF
jgi:NADH:ubiquinone oxidoreductase subunit 4 (subunit M)